MKTGTGQILRLVGLLIEMLGVLGVVAGRPNFGATRLRLPGGTTVAPAWIAVTLGFLIWLIGTILVVASRPSRS